MPFRIEMPNTLGEPVMREDSLPEERQWWHENPNQAVEMLSALIDDTQQTLHDTHVDEAQNAETIMKIMRIIRNITGSRIELSNSEEVELLVRHSSHHRAEVLQLCVKRLC